MKKEALAAIMATTLLVLSLLSPVAGAVSISYAADSSGDSVSISESYDVDDTAKTSTSATGKTLDVDQKKYSLKRFEDFLVNQSEHEDLLEWWHEQDPPLEDPQPGFCGIYRNFETRLDFGGTSAGPRGVTPGLVEGKLPWRPSDFGLSCRPGFAYQLDWYKIPSCLIRIDPVQCFNGTKQGLEFKFLTGGRKDVDYPNELDDPPDDPFLFTIHWETTFTVNQIDPITPPSVTFDVTSDDDFWLFVNDQLINEVDLGGIHVPTTRTATVTPPLLRVGLNSLDIFYAERHENDGYLKLVIEPGPSTWVTINDPSHICAKKSFEDLLKHQEERIKSFEDLLKTIPPENRTFELLESFENLTKEQEELLKSFERLIKNETPPDSAVNRTEGDYLLEAELVNLLDSFEDLLHGQYELIESFGDLLDESKGYLFNESEQSELNFTKLLFSKEDLIRSQDQLLESFEQLIWVLFENVNYNVSMDQKEYFLKSFEDLLMNQSELLKKFEDLLEWWHEQDPPLEDPQPGFCGIYRNFIPTRASGGHPDFNCNVVNGPSPGLIENNPPWRPTSPPQIEDDWYHTASCLVTIDPAVAVANWPDFTGLDFTPNINAWSNIHPELDERLPGDPCYFTAHWETTITVADWLGSTPVTFKMRANDDSWLFLDGELIIDRGGGHTGSGTASTWRPSFLSPGTYAIDLFYAERCNIPPGGMFEFGISPGPPQVIINDPSHICAKKSFEDLLKRQAERIKSFGDLFETIPPSNRTFELFESFENLTKEQEELLKSFEVLIKNETPPERHVNWKEGNYLLEAELVNLLDSFEDLLHGQYELIESFDDLFDESKGYLFNEESELNFTKLLFSKEDLIRSQDQLLESFEQLIWVLFENVNYNVSIDQKEYFLKSFEDLLMNQSELLKEFEDLLEWWYKHDPSVPPQVIINDPLEICAKKSFEDLLKRQEGRVERFEDLLENYSAMESDF